MGNGTENGDIGKLGLVLGNRLREETADRCYIDCSVFENISGN